MNYRIITKYYYLTAFLLLTNSVFSQNEKQEKMELLNFMVGEWIGTSKVYEKGIVSKQGSAYQKITYDLDKSILVIELNTELLQLHTIIYYDEKDNKYYYYPFSKRGVSRYPAEYRNGKLIVWSNEKNRFIFNRTLDGGFREYGEQLVDGKWTKYFEDTFKNSQ
ncbi:hypothetical protein [Aquimarina sp. Aq78]|uniref:hypothetical protein n=1 Tax=Aquimarina sp. Aq78 TaxID=1191889 RepID=UPI000D0F10B6|nr:hypothetical protein [Aquimarina sp. Aq78]